LLAVLSASAKDKKDYVPVYPTDIKVEADVAYLPADRKEKLDIYHPVGVSQSHLAPAVIYYHGGGFNDGDKAKEREIGICSDLARAGFLAVSVNYKLRRMQGQVTWPRNIHDCKLALRWVRDNAARLGIDPDRIAVMGGSAGGAIAALLAYTEPSDGLEPSEAGTEPAPKVACVVDLYGPMEFMTFHDLKMFAKTREEAPELYKQASPITYLDKEDPPTFVVHGTADETVNIEQSGKLVAKLKELGVPHEYVVIEHAPHSFDLRPLQMDLKPPVFAFLKKYLGGPEAGKP
jgi:acetyl esterase/lipase